MKKIAALALAAAAWALPTLAQDTQYKPVNQQIPPPGCLTLKGAWEGGYTPCTDVTHQQWLTDVTHWRMERRIRTGYDDARYHMPALQWAQSAFIQPQMMVQDRYFYDPVAHKYTVDRYLDDLDKRYGGIDAVLIWPTYPNMGIDDRNQQDMMRSMPGGVAGVRQMVEDFHQRGVHVLFPMMMWDQGTRDPGKSWPDAIAGLMKEIDADGINGDTQDGVPLAFSLAAERSVTPGVRAGGRPADEALAWDVLTWGQYKFQFVPTVDRYRWLEPRHQVNIQGRWNRDKTDDLQFAFLQWRRLGELGKRVGHMERRDPSRRRSDAAHGDDRARGGAVLASTGWEPFFPMRRYGVFASRWPLEDRTVWTIVNRNEYDVDWAADVGPGGRRRALFRSVSRRGTDSRSVREKRRVLSISNGGARNGAVMAVHGSPEAKHRRADVAHEER